MGKLSYLAKTLSKQFKKSAYWCPNCGEKNSFVIERKYFITSLRRCGRCGIMYRAPSDSISDNEKFYNDDYEQGFTTDMPDELSLRTMLEDNFKAGEKDYSYYISVIDMLGYKAGCRLFDFGCSWGYGSYQLAKAGFDVQSFEISIPRARYAEEKLGVSLIKSFDEWSNQSENKGTFDIFFSSHVIEHVPSPSKMIASAKKLLKPGGLFIAFHPNGSLGSRAANPEWSKLWGEVHPNYLDSEFYDQALAEWPRMYGSSPVYIDEKQSDFLKASALPATLRLDNLESMEMFVAARR